MPLIKLEQFAIPASAVGDGAEIVRRLSETRLTKKEKARYISMLVDCVKSYQYLRAKPLPTGKLLSIKKEYSVAMDEVTFYFVFDVPQEPSDASASSL